MIRRNRNLLVALVLSLTLTAIGFGGPLRDAALLGRWVAFGAVALAAATTAKRARLPAPQLTMVFVGFALCTTVWSDSPIITMLKVCSLILFVGSLRMIATVPSETAVIALVRGFRALHLLMVATSFVALLVTPGQALDEGALQGALGSPNALGILLACTAPAFWTSSSSMTWGKRGHILILAAGPSLLVWTGSRTAMMMLLIAGTVCAPAVRSSVRVVIGYLALLFIVVLVIAGHSANAQRWVVDGLLFKGERSVLASRDEVFVVSIASAREVWLFGRGFGIAAGVDEDKGKRPSELTSSGHSREVGNSYLGIVEQTGIAGLLLVAGIIGTILGRAGRSLRIASYETSSRRVLLGIFVGGLVAANFEAFLFTAGAPESLLVWSSGVAVASASVRAPSAAGVASSVVR